MKTFFIEEPILNTSLMVMHDCTGEEAHDHLKSGGVKEVGFHGMFWDGWYFDVKADNHTKGYSFRSMWLNIAKPEIVVHEVVHLVMATFDDSGIPISADNQETFAYHVGFWTKGILKGLRKK